MSDDYNSEKLNTAQAEQFLSALHGNIEDRSIFAPWKDGAYHESGAFSSIHDVISSLRNDADGYVSVNEFAPVFGSISRKSENCKMIKDVFIDLDLHKDEGSVSTLLNRINECVGRGDIPCPTFVVHTGRGLALHYIYKEGIRTENTEEVRKHNSNYAKIFARLKELVSDVAVVDTTVKDHSRVCRIPGTYNTKAGVFAKTVAYSECRYTADELAAGFHLSEVSEIVNEKKKATKPAKNVEKKVKEDVARKERRQYADGEMYDINTPSDIAIAMMLRAKNLEEWLEEINGDCMTRELFVFIYFNSLLSAVPVNIAIKKTLEINEKFIERLDDKEINTTIRVLLDHGLYRLSNDYVSEKLGMSNWHRAARIFKKYEPKIASLTERAERRQAVRDAFASGMKQKDIAKQFNFYTLKTIKDITAKDVDKRREERDSLIRKLYNEGNTPSVIAKTAGCCRRTVYNVLNGAAAYAKKQSGESSAKNECAKSHSFNKCWREERERGGERRMFPHRFKTEKLSLIHSMVLENVKKSKENEIDERTELFNALEKGQNVYLFGNGGTGKSYAIKQFYDSLSKNEQEKTLMLAYTGKAASNLPNGNTIHSAFRLETSVFGNESDSKVPLLEKLLKVNKIVIDEIGNVRIDLFTHIMRLVKKAEKWKGRRIQVIVTGDFGQIKPVATLLEMVKLKKYYPDAQSLYCYESPMWSQMGFHEIYLTKVMRQQDVEFVSMLDYLKYGSLGALAYFNYNLDRHLSPAAVYICPTNKLVRQYNSAALKQFKDVRRYEAVGKNAGYGHELLCLAEGARVMATRNCKNKYQNGSTGMVTKFADKYVEVLFDGASKPVKIRRVEIEKGVKQFPLQLAYAITVDKAQGMTFDEVNIIPGFFSAGQLYVALTRCKTFENIHILGSFEAKELIVDEYAVAYGLDKYKLEKILKAETAA